MFIYYDFLMVGAEKMKKMFLILLFSGFYTSLHSESLTTLPDTFLSRLKITSVIQLLDVRLLSSSSATATLEKWCSDHRLAQEPKIIANRIKTIDKIPSLETRQRLNVDKNELVLFRHVELRCGEHILSEADNWYVPSRLSPEINKILEQSDVPFGKAIGSLKPIRKTFYSQLLWSPLPENWEMNDISNNADKISALPFHPAHFILEHRALVLSHDQTPLSEVDENYTDELLKFDWRAY